MMQWLGFNLPPYCWEFHIILVVTVVSVNVYTIWKKQHEQDRESS